MNATSQWTMAKVRARSLETGHPFYLRKTMKFFGETMKNYRLTVKDGKIIVSRRGGKAGKTRLLFDPETGGMTSFKE